MSRNLVLCFDGTGAKVQATGNSNPVLTYELLDLSDPQAQVGYYDPGVGTMAASGAWSPPARWASRVAGLAFGAGLRAKIGDAYTWLTREWRPGDRIFLFGFSRGAYTARALTGLLREIGILRPGSDNLIPYVVAQYARTIRNPDQDFAVLHQLAHIFGQHHDDKTAVHVHYLGAWDTVNSVGLLRWHARWPYTTKLPYVQRIRHAVAIDEWRRPFSPALVKPTAESRLEEVWFAGVHSDIGGTFKDNADLSTITLKWLLEGAIEEGLLVQPAVYAARTAVNRSFASGVLHTNGWPWHLLGTHRRYILDGAAVHDSVRTRSDLDPRYRPPLPATPVWVDPAWADPPPL